MPTCTQHTETTWGRRQGGPDRGGFAGLRSVGCTEGCLGSFQKDSQMPSHCRLQATWLLSQPCSFSLPCRVVQNVLCDVVLCAHMPILGFMLLGCCHLLPPALPFSLLIPPHSIRLSLRVNSSKKPSPNSFPRLALAPLLVTPSISSASLSIMLRGTATQQFLVHSSHSMSTVNKYNKGLEYTIYKML